MLTKGSTLTLDVLFVYFPCLTKQKNNQEPKAMFTNMEFLVWEFEVK